MAEPTVAERYDGLFFDLDGTLYRGTQVIPGAPESLDSVSAPVVFVTNNASRRPEGVAEHLRDFGFRAAAGDVMTSAQAALTLLSPDDVPVLVVGDDSFRSLLREAGFAVVTSADDAPGAVVQGLSKTLAWPDLAEGCLAIRSGARWIATNLDPTIPTERGFLPGNGSLVAAMRVATDAEPVVAGKPSARVFAAAAERVGATNGLVVGDRLDTDIQGGVAAGMDAMAVLTGSVSVPEILAAPPGQRPTHLGESVAALHEPESRMRIAGDPLLRCSVEHHGLRIVSAGDALDGLSLARAVIAAAWDGGRDRLTCSDPALSGRLTAAGLPVG